MIAMLASACSMFVRGAPDPVPPGYQGTCTDYYTLPAIDAVIATAGLVGGIAGIASDRGGDVPVGKVFGGLAALASTPFVIGAVIGFSKVAECRAAKRAAGLPLTPSKPGLDAFAEVSPSILAPASFRAPSFPLAAGQETSPAEIGIGGDASLQQGWAEVGIGARYGFAPGDPVNGHFMSLPVTLAGRIPISGPGAIRIAVGVGLALGVVRDYGPESSTLISWGPTGEASLAYVHDLRRFELRFEIGARSDILKKGGEVGEQIEHVQLPYLRIGAAW